MQVVMKLKVECEVIQNPHAGGGTRVDCIQAMTKILLLLLVIINKHKTCLSNNYIYIAYSSYIQNLWSVEFRFDFLTNLHQSGTKSRFSVHKTTTVGLFEVAARKKVDLNFVCISAQILRLDIKSNIDNMKPTKPLREVYCVQFGLMVLFSSMCCSAMCDSVTSCLYFAS